MITMFMYVEGVQTSPQSRCAPPRRISRPCWDPRSPVRRIECPFQATRPPAPSRWPASVVAPSTARIELLVPVAESRSTLGTAADVVASG